MNPEQLPPVKSTGDRLTEAVKSHISEATWALFERQAQLETLNDAYTMVMQPLDTAHKKIAVQEQIIAAYVALHGELPPPEGETVTALAPEDPSMLVDRINGLREKRDRARSKLVAGD